MGRTIVTSKPVAPHMPGQQLPQQPVDPDNYVSKIVKLIPADIVGVYLGLQGLFSGIAEDTRFGIQLGIFILILIISPFFLKRVAAIKDNKQITVAVISYVIWAISLGGPFEYLLGRVTTDVTAQQIGGGLVMFYTLLVPMFYKS